MRQPTEIRSRKDLPDDPEELRNYSWELTLCFKELTEKYRKAIGHLHGRSSEKQDALAVTDALQIEMDGLLAQAGAVEKKLHEAEQLSVEVTGHRRRRKHPGRNAIPEELITDQLCDVSEAEKRCGSCGRPKAVIETKSHVVVERIPAQYRATRYLTPVYACSCCKDGVSKADPVNLPIPKGLAGPGLLSFVILSKYLYHLPLYRIQRQIFHESGIWFTRSTLSSWVGRICFPLARIHRALLEQYRQSRIKHADETPLRVKRDGHLREGWMWVGLSGDERTAVFVYDRHRSGKAAEKLLEGSQCADVLMVDDCPAYTRPVKMLKLIDLRCMVHIRRKFVEALKTGSHAEFNKRMLIKIAQLYRIERIARKLNLSHEKRGELRHRYSARIMDQIEALLNAPGTRITPKSATGIAAAHFKKNWVPATRFIDNGEYPIDNSADERIIRPFAIGRNNWGQAGSERGARWMATLYTVITTCKLNGVDPYEYLCDVAMRLPIRPPLGGVGDLTPVEWYKARNNGELPPKTPLYPSKH